MLKMSILWDEKKNTDLDSKDMLEVFSSVLADYQKENASASDVAFFVGLATGSDKELLHILLNLPSETCSKLLEYIRNYTSKPNENPAKPTLKKLLLTSPHKDLEIPIGRPSETGREIGNGIFD